MLVAPIGCGETESATSEVDEVRESARFCEETQKARDVAKSLPEEQVVYVPKDYRPYLFRVDTTPMANTTL